LVILATVFVGEIAQGLLFFSAVPLVLVVERDLHLTASQVAFWVNLRLMFVFLCAIPVGLLIDRLGAKRLARIGFLLLAAGATARGFVSSYETLLLATSLRAWFDDALHRPSESIGHMVPLKVDRHGKRRISQWLWPWGGARVVGRASRLWR
jgi:MFS family permease